MTANTRNFINERIGTLQTRRIRPEDVPYEMAAALYEIALQLDRLADTAEEVNK